MARVLTVYFPGVTEINAVGDNNDDHDGSGPAADSGASTLAVPNLCCQTRPSSSSLKPSTRPRLQTCATEKTARWSGNINSRRIYQLQVSCTQRRALNHLYRRSTSMRTTTWWKSLPDDRGRGFTIVLATLYSVVVAGCGKPGDYPDLIPVSGRRICGWISRKVCSDQKTVSQSWIPNPQATASC